jgi:hypothetical protein
LVEMWGAVSLTFYPGWSQTVIPPISTSWVVRITSVSHCGQLLFQLLVAPKVLYHKKRDA